MELEIMFKRYLSYVQVYNSVGTYEFTLQYVHKILNYWGNIDSIELTKQSLLDWFLILKKQGLSANTINKILGLLKRVYKYNEEECPFKEMQKLKIVFKTYGMVDQKEVAKIAEGIKSLNLRNQLIFILLAETGIRSSELRFLKTKNLNIHERFIYVEKTKTNSPRNVFFSKSTEEILNHYLKEYPWVKNNYLFCTQDNHTQLTKSGLDTIFKQFKKKNRIKNLSPHKLRHTLSTQLYNNGANLEFISSLLGHSNPNTTKRYIHHDMKQDRDKFDLYFKK